MNNEDYPRLVAELFKEFVTDARRLRCGAKEKIMPTGTEVDVDFDHSLPENHERTIRCMWDAASSQWAGIESVPTYTITMTSIIQRLMRIHPAPNRKFKILSLGTGPGLYEMFLANMYRIGNELATVYSLDYSEKMVEFQKETLQDKRLTIRGSRLASLEPHFFQPVCGDMTDLSRFYGKIDLVICNNSLQWVKEWKKAVAEMGKVMNPEGAKAAFLVIHPHPMSLLIGDTRLCREHVEIEALRDEMREAKFEPCWQRLMLGAPGSGQGTTKIERMFMDFNFKPQGAGDWRTFKLTPGGAKHMKLHD